MLLRSNGVAIGRRSASGGCSELQVQTGEAISGVTHVATASRSEVGFRRAAIHEQLPNKAVMQREQTFDTRTRVHEDALHGRARILRPLRH
jgi:hypothetical protein